MNGETLFGRLGGAFVVLAGLSLSACGGATTFASSWRSPKAEPLNMKGKPVAAVVMMQNEGTRRNAEDVLAREITHYGGKGIPMYTLFEENPVGNEAAAKAAIERAQVKGIVVMRPMGTKKRTETHQSYSSPYYGSYWGGYYPYGWGYAYGPGLNPYHSEVNQAPTYLMPSTGGSVETYKTTTEVVQVEVLVYSLQQNLLVWAGVSETTEPGKVDDFVTQLSAVTAEELADVGLLSN